MTERGTGWVGGLEPTPELVRASAAHVEIALGGALVRGLEGGLTRDPWVLNQFKEQCCTAELGIGHIYGLTGVKCSPYIPWWAARVSDAGSEDIDNIGVSVHSFVRALREHGACLWEKWNHSSPGFDINKKPPALARIGAQKHNLDMIPIYASGTDAIEGMCEALDRQCPGGVVINVDDAYSIPGFGGVVGPERGTLKGQHGVTVWRYRTADSGRREFLSPGSWGTNFGDNGLTWLDESRIANSVFLCFSQGVS